MSVSEPTGEEPTEAPPELPISSDELLAGFDPDKARSLEIRYGNADLIRVLELLDIAGPFQVLSPWTLADERGRELIHAGGYAALPFGERYPPLLNFMRRFLEEDSWGGLAHHASAWRAALETNLVALLAREAPSHADSGVIFGNSGAEAIEAALKLVRSARPKARHLLTFERGYHGKTFGALSITPNEEFQAPFRPLLPDVEVLPYGDANALETRIKALGADSIIAIVLEPIQGEGGVVVPPPDFLPAVQQLAREHNLLVVADEIQTGLGRSGHWFASLEGGLEPDVITLAKPLGGGMVPIGATIARRQLIRTMLPGLEAKRHSSTFSGNSLAMAVGMRSLELLLEEKLVARAQTLGREGLTQLEALKKRYPGYISEVRGAGMLFALKLRRVLKPVILAGNAEVAHQLGTALAIRALHLGGVHVCYSNNASRVIRLTPALNIPEPLFNEMFERIETTIQDHRYAWQMLPRMPVAKLLKLARIALLKK